MVTTREDNYKKSEQLSDGAIMDIMNTPLCGSLGYHDKIVAMIAQGHKTDKMVLEFKHYDLPEELIDMFWKFGEAERIIECAKKQTQLIFEYVHKKDYEENHDIHYDEIDFKFIVDDDKLVSSFARAKDERVLNKDLVVIDGIVISKTDVVPEVAKHVYRCQMCQHKYDNKVRACVQCDSKNIKLSLPDCKFVNREYLTIQEHQKDMKPGSVEPETMEVVCYGSLIKRFYPGNYVRVTGFPKAVEKKGEYSIIMKAHNIQHVKTPLEVLISNPKKLLSERDEKAILAIRKRYNDMELVNVLINSFARHIQGNEIIKETILLQVVGGSKIEAERSNINILIVGDPGLAKTKLLYAAKEINIHAAMAVGKGASGVGLTASVVKDYNGRPRLSVGIACIADKGVCIIDELSNIADEYKAHLLECMENGTITINKHGINQTLKANAAFLVATNPDAGRYTTENSLTENIKISPPLLSRFDIIFVLIDRVDNEQDQRLNIHSGAKWNATELPTNLVMQTGDKLDQDMLFKFLVYAKLTNPFVRISKEALKRFDAFYSDLRQPKRSSDITATRRQYEALCRFGTALARLLLKSEVTEEMADHIIQIMNHAFQSTGMKLGNSTGLNQTMIYSKPLNKVHPKKAFIMVMQNLTKNNTIAVEKEAVIIELRDNAGIDVTDAYELWEKMDRAGALSVENGRFYKLNYDNLMS